MSATLSSAAKDAMMGALLSLINGGTLEIGTANMTTVLATINLPASGGVAASGVLTLDTSPPLTATASHSGTAKSARIKGPGGAAVISNLVVGLELQEVDVDTTNVSMGNTVQVVAVTITLP